MIHKVYKPKSKKLAKLNVKKTLLKTLKIQKDNTYETYTTRSIFLY